jgi:hypothetical protein
MRRLARAIHNFGKTLDFSIRDQSPTTAIGRGMR